MREQTFEDALNLTSERQYKAAIELIKPILEDDCHDITYYKALKLYADIVGPMTKNDLFLAIDMYQTIISECEDDAIYLSAQVTQLEAQLTISIHFMESFENTRDVIETDDDFAENTLQRLDVVREKFIVGRAETIYKNRM